MLYFTHPLNALLMIAIPLVVWVWLWRRWRGLPTGEGFVWRWVAVGALMFVASQLVRLPLLAGLTALFQTGVLPAVPAAARDVFNLTVLCVTAGLFEEGARYLGYRTLARDARTWRAAVVYGAGHGGIEAIIIGGLTALTVVNMFALQGMDLSTLPLTPDQRAVLTQQVTEFWAAPWPMTLLGALERVFAVITHITLSVLVLQAVARRQWAWLAAAMAWHALVNAIAVSVAQAAGPVWAEAALAGCTVVSLAILFGLRRATPAPPPAPAPATAP